VESLERILRTFRGPDVRPRSESLPVWDVGKPGLFARRRRKRDAAVEQCRSRLLAALLATDRPLFLTHPEPPQEYGVPGTWRPAGPSTWLVPSDLDVRGPAVVRWLFVLGNWGLYRGAGAVEGEWPDLFRCGAPEVLSWMADRGVEALIVSFPDNTDWVVAARRP
jgi:hypothetical protein